MGQAGASPEGSRRGVGVDSYLVPVSGSAVSGAVSGSGVSRALFGNNFRIRNRPNEAAERRPINFKFFNGMEVFSGLGVDYEYRDGA